MSKDIASNSQTSPEQLDKANKIKISNLLKRTGIWLLTIVFSIYLLVWAFSPMVARWQINKQLEAYNLELSDDSSMRLNPFILELSLWDIQLSRRDSVKALASIQSAQVDINTFALFSKTIEFESFNFNKILINSERNPTAIAIAGFLMPTVDSETENQLPAQELPVREQPTKVIAESAKEPQASSQPWILLADKIEFNDITVDINNLGTQHQLIIESFKINQATVDELNQKLSFQLQAQFDDAPFEYQVSLQNTNGTGQLDSKLSIQSFGLNNISYLLAPKIELLNGEFNLSLEKKVEFSGSDATVTFPKIDLSLNQLQVETAGIKLNSHYLATQLSEVQIDTKADSNPIIKANFAVSSQNTKLSTLNDDNVLTSYQNFEISEGSISLDETQQPAVTFKQLNADNIVASHKETIKNSPAIALLNKLTINDLSLVESHLSIASLNLDKLTSSILLDQEKNLANLVLPAQTESTIVEEVEAAEVETKAEEPSAQEFTFSLEKLTVSDKSQISFSDASVQPAFFQAIQLNKIEVNSIDTRDAGQKTTFDLQVKTDAYAATQVKGFIQPFSEKLNLTVESTVREFSLPKVSPYMKDAMGFEMLSGQFDTDINIVIKDDIIEGESKLNMRGLELSSADNGESDSLKDQSAMPLNSALGLLMDDKGNLELDIPLSGDVSEPEFGVSNFIALVSKKAIMSAAETYLIETFVPYANVLSVVMIAGEYMLKVSFEDLVYTPTIIDIQPEHMTFVGEFTKLVQDKPDTQVKVCAIATPADLPGVPVNIEDENYLTQLREISNQRGQAFKAWLVDKSQIESSKLLICQPQVDTSDDGKPRIEFEV